MSRNENDKAMNEKVDSRESESGKESASVGGNENKETTTRTKRAAERESDKCVGSGYASGCASGCASGLDH